MNDYAANSKEPNDDREDFSKVCSVLTYNAVDGDGLEELETDVQVEDGRDADRTEEADEDGLAFLFDLVDEFVHREDNWEASVKPGSVQNI